jgi:hypothetical protein
MRQVLFCLCSVAALSLPVAAYADEPPGGQSQVTVTGSNGGGFTSATTGTRDREAGTWQRDRDTTFNNGATRSVTVDGQVTGPGTADVTRTVSDRNGESHVQTGALQTTQTENGRITTGQWQGQNGSATTTRDINREDGARTVNGSVTNEAGATRTTQGVFTQTGPGEGVFNRTVTGPGGNSRTSEGAVTRTRRRP